MYVQGHGAAEGIIASIDGSAQTAVRDLTIDRTVRGGRSAGPPIHTEKATTRLKGTLSLLTRPRGLLWDVLSWARPHQGVGAGEATVDLTNPADSRGGWCCRQGRWGEQKR